MRKDRRPVLVCYDIGTTDDAGRLRLTRAAKVCVAFGTRVQDSVYECFLTEHLLAKLRDRLLKIIDPEEDSLRFYFLAGPRCDYLEVVGLDKGRDPDRPLIF